MKRRPLNRGVGGGRRGAAHPPYGGQFNVRCSMIALLSGANFTVRQLTGKLIFFIRLRVLDSPAPAILPRSGSEGARVAGL